MFLENLRVQRGFFGGRFYQFLERISFSCFEGVDLREESSVLLRQGSVSAFSNHLTPPGSIMATLEGGMVGLRVQEILREIRVYLWLRDLEAIWEDSGKSRCPQGLLMGAVQCHNWTQRLKGKFEGDEALKMRENL